MSDTAANPRRKGDLAVGWVLAVGGALGLFSAFQLSLEKLETIKDADYTPACDINPILSCGAVMNTPQGEAFGFANPFIGLMAFPIVIAVGLAVLSRVKLPRWWWVGMEAGALFGVVFVHWLIFQSVYRIGALCPYCMLVWSVTIPIFWFVSIRNVRRLRISPDWREPVNSLLNVHWIGLAAWFAAIIALIVMQFGVSDIFSF